MSCSFVLPYHFWSARSASWSLRLHSFTSERAAEKQKRRVCLILRSWPHRELRKRLAVAVLHGVERGHFIVNTGATDSGVCGVNLISQNVILKCLKCQEEWKIENMLNTLHPHQACWECWKYKVVALDIKAWEQTCEACTHTHRPRHTPLDIILETRHIIYMQNPQSPKSPC